MSGMKQARKFGGRPIVREPQLGKRVQLNVALPLPLKRKIEQEASRRGHSISNEAASLLEWALDRRGLLPDVLALAYGRQLAGLVMALGSIMSKAGRTASSVRTIDGGENWITDPHAFDQAVKAALDLLVAARPPGEPRPEQYDHLDAKVAATFKQYDEEKPRTFVIELINAIKLNPTRGTFADEALQIRALLGPVLAELLKSPTPTEEAADYEKLIEKVVVNEAKKARRKSRAR
jgi:hypothetical protein